MIHIYIYIYPFLFRLFSHIYYYRVLSRVPHATRESLLVIYFIYSSMYLSISNSQFIPSPCSLLVTIISFLNLWLYFCFVNKFISKNFLDFTYERYHIIFIFLLRVPWTARRSNQSILKEISPEYSLEGLMLKLKLQYFGHLLKRPWCWGRLKAWGEGDDKG